ncbi:MAG: hypothetical protein R3297_04715, partial [Desulfobulbales bacterium]|nr:hypothetical protein [Desulfobulbales bacterium]
MKHRKTNFQNLMFMLLAALALVAFAAGPVSAAWTTVPVEVNPELGLYTRSEIAVDSTGVQHIIFEDLIVDQTELTNDHQLRYGYNDGTGWVVQDVDGARVGDDALELDFTFALALDSNDNPHVTYYTGTTIEHLTSADNGATWTGATVFDAALFEGATLMPVHDFSIDRGSDTLYSFYVVRATGGTEVVTTN